MKKGYDIKIIFKNNKFPYYAIVNNRRYKIRKIKKICIYDNYEYEIKLENGLVFEMRLKDIPFSKNRYIEMPFWFPNNPLGINIHYEYRDN